MAHSILAGQPFCIAKSTSPHQPRPPQQGLHLHLHVCLLHRAAVDLLLLQRIWSRAIVIDVIVILLVIVVFIAVVVVVVVVGGEGLVHAPVVADYGECIAWGTVDVEEGATGLQRDAEGQCMLWQDDNDVVLVAVARTIHVGERDTNKLKCVRER